MGNNKQKFGFLFEKWELKNLKLNMEFLELEFSPTPDDQDAAWDMYVELITRITTQALDPNSGDEATALTSVYNLFDITRQILKDKGRKAQAFSKIAVIVLNQIVRPFTAKWHKKKLAGAFNNTSDCKHFRDELCEIQKELSKYSGMLAELAGVEDLTYIEQLN